MTVYALKPDRFLSRIHTLNNPPPARRSFCAGFELKKWRCAGFADHLLDWLPDYALAEEELNVNHANAFVKLRQAAVRVYTTREYAKRGEVGEIAIHAICRDFFDTIPISARVFYKSSSNDVVKAFDLVHARFPKGKPFEIWLGESKIYANSAKATAAAIHSIVQHIDSGFLQAQKLILGPQLPKNTPNYDALIQVFKTQTSIDEFLKHAVFVAGIFSDSKAACSSTLCDEAYKDALLEELSAIQKGFAQSGLASRVKILLIYVPLAKKRDLVDRFDARLKALQ